MIRHHKKGDKADGEVKEEYPACIIIYITDNSSFGTINTYL